jgi:hypothetical protein
VILPRFRRQNIGRHLQRSILRRLSRDPHRFENRIRRFRESAAARLHDNSHDNLKKGRWRCATGLRTCVNEKPAGEERGPHDDPGVQGGWKQDPNDEAHDHDIGSASYVQSATCRLVDWMIPHSSTRAFPVLLPLACLCADLASSALLRLPPNQGLCQEYRFDYYGAWSALVRAWAIAEQGGAEEGAAAYDTALKEFRMTGAGLRMPLLK